MPPLYIAALTAALAAVICLCCNASDGWFFGLLALTCLLAAAYEAYQERDPVAVGFLTGAGLFGVLAVRAIVRDRDRRAGDTP
ncbi:hypothetical protein [Streptomyces scabiei]|uniref:hypothetical protein n=1 Tax=Streptomyces scabiei TaxID=1930 RepID=UPI0029A5B18E|nr:hypothetical protein [Streptomyces scabiei]MDX3026763.1 hypothetical protein [Streptomyces scabiei]MDX3210041.1 hypothetical protein [Streptomyces scabiei]